MDHTHPSPSTDCSDAPGSVEQPRAIEPVTGRGMDGTRWSRVVALLADHPVLAIFTVALGVRLIVGAGVRLAFDGFLFGDELFYAQIATDLAYGTTENWGEYEHSLDRVMGAFLYALAGVYRVFGSGSYAGQVMVALMGAGTAALAFMLARPIVTAPLAVFAGAVVALLPSQVLFSSITLRDAGSWMLLAACAVAMSRYNKRTGGAAAAAAVTACGVLIVLGFVRVQTFVAASIAVAVAGWFGRSEQRLQRGVVAVAMGMLLPLLLGYGLFGFSFLRDAGDFEARRIANALNATTAVVPVGDASEHAGASPPPTVPGEDEEPAAVEELPGGGVVARFEGGVEREFRPDGTVVERLEDDTVRTYTGDIVVERRSDGRTRTYTGSPPVSPRSSQSLEPHKPLIDDEPVDPGGPKGLAYVPRGLVVFLLEPLPWREGGVSVRLGQLESLAWYPLLLLAIVGVWGVRRNLDTAAFPVTVAALLTAGYGMAEGNFGTAFRHRGEIVWAVAVVAAAGLRVLLNWHRARRAR